jgi:threonine aldolase
MGMILDLNFASDNVMGASAPVLDALVAANTGSLSAYGTDTIAREVEETFAELFERRVAMFLVATGTAANALAVAAMTTPWGLCVCHEEAHIIDDECGAPEFFSHGAKLMGVPGVGGKLEPAALEAALDRLPNHEKQMPAQALSISQATEAGLVYGLGEIEALSGVCRRRGLTLHMDGARFANALVSLDTSPAEMTWRRGVDILSFGATKNGCLAAEAILVFDEALAATLRFRRKRSGHTLSKGRLLSAQLRGYLADGHWLDNARHANRMAGELSAGLAALPGVRIAWPTDANEVFAILPERIDAALRQAGAAYYPWTSRSLPPDVAIGPDEVLVRFVTSFATEPGAVPTLVEAGRMST